MALAGATWILQPHTLYFEDSPRLVILGGETVAERMLAKLLYETGHLPVYYSHDALPFQGRCLLPGGPKLMPEERLKDRDYLADEFSLADIAYAGNFVRLRELEERGEVSLDGYPNVAAWMERIETRSSYQRAV